MNNFNNDPNSWPSTNIPSTLNNEPIPNNLAFLHDVTEQRNYLHIGGHIPGQPIDQQHSSKNNSHASSSSSSSSSQSNGQKWEYQSIKQGDDNIDEKQSLLAENQILPEGQQIKDGRIVRYKYCCKKCKHADKDKDKKACVCVVPRDQRRTHLGNQGCQTCGCNGCSKEDFLFRGEDPEYHPQDKKRDSKKKQEKFQARNGCCKGCMKAFSKSGKSCICQVPDDVRKTKLAIGGCKICGCTGCNPEDKKIQKKRQKRSKRSRSRSERKKQKRDRRSRSKDKKRRSRSRSPQIIDTFAMNLHNIDRSIVGSMIINEYQIDPALLGFGIPQRSSSYLFGRN